MEHATPSVIRNQALSKAAIAGGYIALHLANQDSTDSLHVLSVTSADAAITAALDGEDIALLPSQQLALPVKLLMDVDHIPACPLKVTLTITARFSTASEVTNTQVPVKLECRRAFGDAFEYTFQDADGSVQVASTIAPTQRCMSNEAVESARQSLVLATDEDQADWPTHDGCRILLTFHGTGVTSRSQAESHKVGVAALQHEAKKGKTSRLDWIPAKAKSDSYVFGVPNLWLLAPTRHGAHNWEGPGYRTALSAVERLQALSAHPVFADGADDVVTCQPQACHAKNEVCNSMCSDLLQPNPVGTQRVTPRDALSHGSLVRRADINHLIVGGTGDSSGLVRALLSSCVL
jgi:hypothetical protein